MRNRGRSKAINDSSLIGMNYDISDLETISDGNTINRRHDMTALSYPKKVVIGDITVRDGFQHEEKFIPTDAKLWLAEQLILAGFKRININGIRG